MSQLPRNFKTFLFTFSPGIVMDKTMDNEFSFIPMMINKITLIVDQTYWIRETMIINLGASVIYCPMSPPSLIFTKEDHFHEKLNSCFCLFLER